MFSLAIPGYFYDESCDRYFKIQEKSINGAVSNCDERLNRDVILLANSKVQLSELQKLTDKIRSKHSDMPSLLNSTERLRHPYINSHSQSYILSSATHMRHKQQQILEKNIARPTLLQSHGGTRLHVIDSPFLATGLQQYRVKLMGNKDNKLEQQEGESRKRKPQRFSMTACPRSYEGPNCIGCNDAAWIIPGKQMACVGKDDLTIVKTSGTGYEILESIHQRRLGCPQFASVCVSSEPSFSPESPLFFSNNRLIIYDEHCRLLLSIIPYSNRQSSWLPHRSSGDRVDFTAIAKAASVPLLGPSNFPAYIATQSDHTGSQLGLYYLQHAHRPQEMIQFKVQCQLNAIGHLQCITTPMGDRCGLVVGWNNGRTELWDDRWPNKPAVVYMGSGSGAWTSDRSPIPPRPAIEEPRLTTIASPISGHSTVGLWEIKTGQLLNLMDYPPYDNALPTAIPPPMLILRSQWGCNSDGMPLCGPALLAISVRSYNWFYA